MSKVQGQTFAKYIQNPKTLANLKPLHILGVLGRSGVWEYPLNVDLDNRIMFVMLQSYDNGRKRMRCTFVFVCQIHPAKWLKKVGNFFGIGTWSNDLIRAQAWQVPWLTLEPSQLQIDCTRDEWLKEFPCYWPPRSFWHL